MNEHVGGGLETLKESEGRKRDSPRGGGNAQLRFYKHESSRRTAPVACKSHLRLKQNMNSRGRTTTGRGRRATLRRALGQHPSVSWSSCVWASGRRGYAAGGKGRGCRNGSIELERKFNPLKRRRSQARYGRRFFWTSKFCYGLSRRNKGGSPEKNDV